MGQTYNELIRTVTEDYLGGIDMDSIPSPETIENELLQAHCCIGNPICGFPDCEYYNAVL